MKIKTVFMAMLFLLGIAVQFAGAMEPKKNLVLVGKGKITGMDCSKDKKILCTFSYIDDRYAPQEHKRIWKIEEDEPGKSPNELTQLQQQNYIGSLPPIIMSTVAHGRIVTASCNEKESYIRYNLILKPIQIKMLNNNRQAIPALDINLITCCRSETLLYKLADKEQSSKEISLDLTKDQFDSAWSYMRGTMSQKLADMSIQQLCDLIVADSVLKIKTNDEYNLPKDCLSIIKNKFDRETDDAQKGKLPAQMECLPQGYKREIALHIAKNFVDQSRDGTKYSLVKLEKSVRMRNRTVIENGGLTISKGSYYKNQIEITYKRDQRGSAFTHRLSLPHNSEVYEVVISKKENKFHLPAYVVTLTGADKVTVWSSVDGDTPSYRSTVLEPYGNGGTIVSIDITQDGEFVAATYPNHLQIWDVETGSRFMILNHQFYSGDQIVFGKDKPNELCIYCLNSQKFGGSEDKKVDLNNFLERVKFVKSSNVRTAYFVNKLTEKLSSQGSITLTQAEHDELEVSLYKKTIETFFAIDSTKIAETPVQPVTPNQDNTNQPVQPSVDTTTKNDTPETSPHIDQTLPNGDGKPSSYFTLGNFIKFSVASACVLSALYLIFHSMKH